jgi:hypothetical protein
LLDEEKARHWQSQGQVGKEGREINSEEVGKKKERERERNEE